LFGIGALRTDEAVLRPPGRQKAAGASAGLLALVSYIPLTDDEVFEHFFVTVGRESGLPICICKNSGTTHFTFYSDSVVCLSCVPGIVAIKNPACYHEETVAHLQALRGLVPERFSLG